MQKRYLASITTIIALVMILLADGGFNLGLVSKVGNLFRPVGVVFNNTGSGIAGFFSGIGNISNLQKENSKLKNQLNSSLSQIASLTEAKNENDSLRKLLGFASSSNLDYAAGTVTSFDPSLKNGINIHLDNMANIAVGRPVIAEGFMIGRVVAVNGSNIKVSLIVDPTSAIPSKIMGKETTGVSKGVIGNGLIMDQVPQSDNVSENDLIVTSGLGGDLPAGIILAKVTDIQKVSGSIFQEVTLSPMVDLTKLTKVLVVK